MLKRNAKVVAVGLLIVTMLILPAAARAQGAPAVGGPPPGGVMRPFPGGAFANEPHPAIRKSIHMLQRTKFVLQNDAAKDFGGHKAQAIQNIDQAIAQLNMALAADKH